MRISRRTFLKTGAVAVTGLAIGGYYTLESGPVIQLVKLDGFNPNIWLNIRPDNTVTVTVAKAEMGQAVMTAIPMLVAEELDADWSLVGYRQAPVTPEYGNQSTGGSSSIRDNWEIMRQTGAVARQLLITAAAHRWQVTAESCTTAASFVYHPDGKQKFSYGELSTAASKLPIPETVKLKEPDKYSIIGASPARIDIPSKINGAAKFGIDQQRPNLLYAAIKHSPAFDASVAQINDSEIVQDPDVVKVVNLGSSVAVVAKKYWSAHKAVNKLSVQWTSGTQPHFDSEYLRELAMKNLDSPNGINLERGNVTAAMASTQKILTADYELPFQAHATMEPMCCTAHVENGKCEVWAPTQTPNRAHWAAANAAFTGLRAKYHKTISRITGEPSNSVAIHSTLMGGGFGRRRSQDFVHEAVTISREVNAPVKLIWSREEDMQHDFYREWSFHRIEAGIGDDGLPIALHHRLTGPAVRSWGSHDTPYTIPNIVVQAIPLETNYVPLGSWRALAHTYNAYVTETFLDEIAAAGGHDPVDMRDRLLGDATRHRNVLHLAAEKAGWGKPLSDGHFHGVALHSSFGSYVAQVAQISITDGIIKVHKVVCAVDCGLPINPDQIAAQLESAVVFGLTAALKSAISIKDGRVEQSNFHDFPLLRFDEMPSVETHIIRSTESPSGIGEPGVPPIAPAVANAVFAATGKMPRKLPIKF